MGLADQGFRVVFGGIETPKAFDRLFTWKDGKAGGNPLGHANVAVAAAEGGEVGGCQEIGPALSQRGRFQGLEGASKARDLTVFQGMAVFVDDDLRILGKIDPARAKSQDPSAWGLVVRPVVSLEVRVWDPGWLRVGVNGELPLVDVVESQGLDVPLDLIDVVVGHDFLESVRVAREREVEAHPADGPRGVLRRHVGPRQAAVSVQLGEGYAGVGPFRDGARAVVHVGEGLVAEGDNGIDDEDLPRSVPRPGRRIQESISHGDDLAGFRVDSNEE